MDEAEECIGEFVVASGNTASILETIEASFDTIAQGIDGAVDRDLHTPIFLGWNHRHTATLFDIGTNGITVVAAVGEQHLGIGRVSIHQRFVAFDIMRFARRERGADREAFRIRAEMDFGREPTARTAKSVSLNPPLPPAA